MINIMDREFNHLGLIDEYESFIISKNYHGIGGFELHLHVNNIYVDKLQKENIVFTTEDKAYIILYRNLKTTDGTVIIKGLELKSYLSRWLIFPPGGVAYFRINDNVETIMKEYVQATLTRKGVSNITIAPNQGRGDKTVYQSRYKNLAEELEKISLSSGIGWDIKLDLRNKRFVFDVVEGRNLTSSQNIYPQAIFSTEYDNISEQEMFESRMDFANTAIVAGQGEGTEREIVLIGEEQGLNSFELFVDARDIEYVEDLPIRGQQKLSEVEEVLFFDSKILANQNLEYGVDFKLGDMVTINSEDWNLTDDRRITEITEIYEKDGFSLEVNFGESMPTIMDKIRGASDTLVVEGTGSKVGYPVGNISNFSTKEDDGKITLTWQDPEDVTITDSNDNPITISKWKGTKILRKANSYPINESDGVWVVDNGIRDQYKANGFIDTGLVNDTEYFYMAFPYTEDDVFTVDVVNRVSATPSEVKIYGVEIDEANSNPETAVIYTDDAVGFTPASGNNGVFNWGSWESITKDEFEIRPCILNNPAKTVSYYLDYDDYTKKAAGGASVLTGVDGDVMTELGTDIYTKWTVVGSKHKIQFSIKPFEGAAKNAFEVENGYNQFVYYPLLLTQKLFQLLFKNRDGQTALGRGYVDGNSSYATTGNTNTKGFMFGETTGKQQMKFLGIEDYWGNKYQWIDGLVTGGSFNLLIGNSNFNNSGSGYTSHASGISTNTYGYINTVQGGNDKGFIIRGTAGSATTHYCDYGFLYSGRVARFGGARSHGSYAGLARLLLNEDSGSSNATIGARLVCVNNGKLYIGVYLGTTQGGKLRSVSGATPTDNKTIGVFRNEARANNN